MLGSYKTAVEGAGRTLRSLCVAVIASAVLVGCGARPGPETLMPVANPGPGDGQVTLLAVTDRRPVPEPPATLGSGRGAPSYEEFTLLRRPSDDKQNLRPSSDPSADFVTTGRRLLSEAAFDAEVSRRAGRSKPITVFVHGYNYSFQEAVFRLAQLSADSGADLTVPVLFSWPSEGSATGYLADRDAATYARDDLARLLTSLSRKHPNSDIAVVGHSMGAWLVMETLRQLRMQHSDGVINRLDVVLAAPDIDMDVFRKQAEVVGPLKTPLTVMVAADDRALAASGRLAGRHKRLGQFSPTDPQLVAIAQAGRMRVMDISAAPASDGLNHDRYAGLAAHWSRLAQNQDQPGELRRAGIFILGTTGQILSAPFSTAASVLAGE